MYKCIVIYHVHLLQYNFYKLFCHFNMYLLDNVYHMSYNGFVARVTRRMPLVEGNVNSRFSGVCVVWTLVSWILFCRSFLSIYPFNVGHCVGCPSIYGFSDYFFGICKLSFITLATLYLNGVSFWKKKQKLITIMQLYFMQTSAFLSAF